MSRRHLMENACPREATSGNSSSGMCPLRRLTAMRSMVGVMGTGASIPIEHSGYGAEGRRGQPTP